MSHQFDSTETAKPHQLPNVDLSAAQLFEASGRHCFRAPEVAQADKAAVTFLAQLELTPVERRLAPVAPGMAAFASFIRSKESCDEPWSAQDVKYAQTKLRYLEDAVKSELAVAPDGGYPPLIEREMKSYELLLVKPADLSDNNLSRMKAFHDVQDRLVGTYSKLKSDFSTLDGDHDDATPFAKIKQKITAGNSLAELATDVLDLQQSFELRAKNFQSQVKDLDKIISGDLANGTAFRDIETHEGARFYREVLQTYTPLLLEVVRKLRELTRAELTAGKRLQLVNELETFGKDCTGKIVGDSRKNNALPVRPEEDLKPPRLDRESFETIERLPVNQRQAFVETQIKDLQARLSEAREAQIARNQIIQKQDAVAGHRIPSNAEFVSYLKQAFEVETRLLKEERNRVNRQEMDGERWPAITLVGTACSQYEVAPGNHYFQELARALDSVRTLPEAMKLVDFRTRNFGPSFRTISSLGSNDSWNMLEQRKRMVLCLIGLDNANDEEGRNRSEIAPIKSQLQRFGPILDGSDNERLPQYKAALAGQYSDDLKRKSVTSLRQIEECADSSQWKKRLADAFAELKQFNEKNPDSEFLIIISSHGGAQTDLTPDQVRKRMGREGGALGHMLGMTEDQLKVLLKDSIGNSPSIVITGQCHGAAIIE